MMKPSDYQGFRRGVRNLTCESATTLLEALAERLGQEVPPPDSDGLELIELGAVYINDERCMNPTRAVRPGDRLRVHTQPRRYQAPGDLKDRILEESEDSLLVEKPAGLPCDSQVDNVKENLIAFLETARAQTFYAVHRLADETDGLMLVAKSADAQARLKAAFAEGRLRRRYVAYLATLPAVFKSSQFRVLQVEERVATTQLLCENRASWEITGHPLPHIYRLELEFSAARPKEIREELAKLGSPVIGDVSLGSTVELRDSVSLKSAIAFRALTIGI